MTLGLGRGHSNLAGASGTLFGGSVELGGRHMKKGYSSLVLVSLRDPVIREGEKPSTEPVGFGTEPPLRWNTCWAPRTETASKQEEEALSPSSSITVYCTDPRWGPGWQRRSNSFQVPARCQEAEPKGVGLELRNNSWKTSATCFVCWSLTFSWSPWLLAPRFASCLQADLHARTWYFIPVMQLPSLGFSPWLGFALVKSLLGTRHRKATWPSWNGFVWSLYWMTWPGGTRCNWGKFRQGHSSVGVPPPSLVWFSWHVGQFSPLGGRVSQWVVHGSFSSGLKTHHCIERKERVFTLLPREWTILGILIGWLVLDPLGSGEEVLSLWLSWNLISAPVN